MPSSNFSQEFRHLRIPLESIEKATNKFSERNFIAEGGYGKVYRGDFSGGSGGPSTIHAVKRWNPLISEYGVPEFQREIMLLSDNKHENLISLIGFCDENKERILVYEYATNKSLDFHLEKPMLTWVERLKVCLGAARGLEYLHNPKGAQRVLHCDIKSANILLDDKWNAKIADFGFSKLGPATKRSYLVTQAKGTCGYIEPEFFDTMIYTKESDVYSFGVVLLEVLCSRLCVDYRYKDMRRSLVRWAKKLSKDEIRDKLIDPNLSQQMEQDSFDTFIQLVRQCVETEREDRPSMDLIVSTLESALKYQEKRNLRIPLESLRNATNNFDECNVIGRGGFGTVYKGELSLKEGETIFVAVKRGNVDAEPEFQRELKLLSNYNTHENLISLLGFCDENKERILVYKYATNKSLDAHLTNPNFTWVERLKICLGAARGLQYLHNPKGEKVILHCDIKSANILLDENWIAKIADFGFSEYGPATQNCSYLLTHGTKVTYDPEFLKTKIYNKESDIYSFGVVLFEVLCSRFCIDLSYHGDRRSLRRSLLNWAKKLSMDEIREKMIGFKLSQQMDQDSLNTFVKLALQCMETEPERRPSMDLIVSTLESALKYQEERNLQPYKEATGRISKFKRASGCLLGIAVAVVLL